jgi:hypothetical protein
MGWDVVFLPLKGVLKIYELTLAKHHGLLWEKVVWNIKHHYSFCSGTGPLGGPWKRTNRVIFTADKREMFSTEIPNSAENKVAEEWRWLLYLKHCISVHFPSGILNCININSALIVLCVCVCVCMWERERERERETQGQRIRKKMHTENYKAL